MNENPFSTTGSSYTIEYVCKLKNGCKSTLKQHTESPIRCTSLRSRLNKFRSQQEERMTNSARVLHFLDSRGYDIGIILEGLSYLC